VAVERLSGLPAPAGCVLQWAGGLERLANATHSPTMRQTGERSVTATVLESGFRPRCAGNSDQLTTVLE
jgi:hypothetical protein